MDDNPYESPAALDERSAGPPGKRFIAGMGLLGGAFVGATVGTVQGAVLALIAISNVLSHQGQVSLNAAVITLLAASIAGALPGSVIGCGIGAVVGTFAAVFGPSSRRVLLVLGIASVTCCTIVASVLGLEVIALRDESPLGILKYALAVASGTVTGLSGGLVLLRGIARAAWPADDFSSTRFAETRPTANRDDPDRETPAD